MKIFGNKIFDTIQAKSVEYLPEFKCIFYIKFIFHRESDNDNILLDLFVNKASQRH